MSQQDQHPLSDLAYDWVTLVQNKAQALQAYDKYIKDAQQANSPECVQLFQRIHDEDSRQLQAAIQHLQMVLGGQMGNQQQGSQQGSQQSSQRQVGGAASGSGQMSRPSGTAEIGDQAIMDEDTTA